MLLQNLLSFFQQNNVSVLGYKVVKHLSNWPIIELVKLTMLWTTRPRSLSGIPEYSYKIRNCSKTGQFGFRIQ